MLDIRRSELQLIADNWQSQATASLAIRILRPCLKWAEKRELAASGTHQLEPPGPVRTRHRVLSADELRAVWPHLHGNRGTVMKWLMWTACRLNEAAGMTWGEIDGDKWSLPASRTKNGRPRVIPLPRQALALLSELARGEPSELVFPSRRGGVLSNWDRETKRLHALSHTTGWHRHDLRRTVATMLGDLGAAPHVVSVVLGHAHIAEGATARYALSRYQREHRETLSIGVGSGPRIGIQTYSTPIHTLGSFLASGMKDRFASSHARLTEIIPFAARLALDCIGNSDALYHNVEHTMLVDSGRPRHFDGTCAHGTYFAKLLFKLHCRLSDA